MRLVIIEGHKVSGVLQAGIEILCPLLLSRIYRKALHADQRDQISRRLRMGMSNRRSQGDMVEAFNRDQRMPNGLKQTSDGCD
jgi:hypothetical protein